MCVKKLPDDNVLYTDLLGKGGANERTFGDEREGGCHALYRPQERVCRFAHPPRSETDFRRPARAERELRLSDYFLCYANRKTTKRQGEPRSLAAYTGKLNLKGISFCYKLEKSFV